jgi:hypothetical protein
MGRHPVGRGPGRDSLFGRRLTLQVPDDPAYPIVQSWPTFVHRSRITTAVKTAGTAGTAGAA